MILMVLLVISETKCGKQQSQWQDSFDLPSLMAGARVRGASEIAAEAVLSHDVATNKYFKRLLHNLYQPGKALHIIAPLRTKLEHDICKTIITLALHARARNVLVHAIINQTRKWVEDLVPHIVSVVGEQHALRDNRFHKEEDVYRLLHGHGELLKLEDVKYAPDTSPVLIHRKGRTPSLLQGDGVLFCTMQHPYARQTSHGIADYRMRQLFGVTFLTLVPIPGLPVRSLYSPEEPTTTITSMIAKRKLRQSVYSFHEETTSLLCNGKFRRLTVATVHDVANAAIKDVRAGIPLVIAHVPDCEQLSSLESEAALRGIPFFGVSPAGIVSNQELPRKISVTSVAQLVLEAVDNHKKR